MVADRVSLAPARHRVGPYRDVRGSTDGPIFVLHGRRSIKLSFSNGAGLCDYSPDDTRGEQLKFSSFPIAERERIELSQILNETEACIVSVGRSTITRLLYALESNDGFDASATCSKLQW